MTAEQAAKACMAIVDGFEVWDDPLASAIIEREFTEIIEYGWAAHAINRVRMNEDEMLRERLFGADVKEPE